MAAKPKAVTKPKPKTVAKPKPKAVAKPTPWKMTCLQRRLNDKENTIKDLKEMVKDRDRSLLTAARCLDRAAKQLRDSTSSGRNKLHAAQEAINCRHRAMEALENNDWERHDKEMMYANWYQEAADGGFRIIKHKPPLDKDKKTARKTAKKNTKKPLGNDKDKDRPTIVADYIPQWRRG